jgi:hypothetical protein
MSARFKSRAKRLVAGPIAWRPTSIPFCPDDEADRKSHEPALPARPAGAQRARMAKRLQFGIRHVDGEVTVKLCRARLARRVESQDSHGSFLQWCCGDRRLPCLRPPLQRLGRAAVVHDFCSFLVLFFESEEGQDFCSFLVFF